MTYSGGGTMDSEERKGNFFKRVFKKVFSRSFGRRTAGTLALISGLLGVAVISIDPIKFISPLLPLQVDNIIIVDKTVFENFINLITANFIILVSAVTFLLGIGLGLLRKELFNGVKAFWRGLKASPRATLNAPVRAYKRITIWRNWLLQKIEYLQSESAKWKTTFNVLKSPYSLLRAMGLSPQMAASFIIAGSTVGTGVVVNETILAERSFSNGDSGVYLAPVDTPVTYSEGDNTLRIDLSSTPVREITIENVSVGEVFTGSSMPSGQANVVQVSGNPTAQGFTATRIEVGTLIFENSRCRKLTLSDMNIHTLTVIGNASDGQSLAPSPGAARMRAIGGGHHQAEALITSCGTYDRIWLQAPESGGNAQIGTQTLSNLYTKGGDCVLSAIDASEVRILTNEIGLGNGFSTKEFVIETSVKAANMSITDNVEVSIGEPAVSTPE